MLAAATLLTSVAPRIVVAADGLEFYLMRKMFSFAAFSIALLSLPCRVKSPMTSDVP